MAEVELSPPHQSLGGKTLATSEEEWKASQAEGRDPDAVPWPAEDVRPLANGADAEDENEAGFRIVQDATRQA